MSVAREYSLMPRTKKLPMIMYHWQLFIEYAKSKKY